MIKKLNEQELDLIEVLLKGGETGVIGETAVRKLKRKPSDIYWNGIRTYGIFEGSKMSIHDYARVACLVKEKKRIIKGQGNEDELDRDDADAVVGELSSNLLRLPEGSAYWRDNLSIRLTKREAVFLRNQIKTTKDSMLGYVLETNHTDFLSCENFDDFERLLGTYPKSIQDDYRMAKEFASFIYGAHIRYNVMLSKGKDDKVNKKWELWSSKIEEYAALDLKSKLVIAGMFYSREKRQLKHYFFAAVRVTFLISLKINMVLGN